jgi:signal transduction histidine kinase
MQSSKLPSGAQTHAVLAELVSTLTEVVELGQLPGAVLGTLQRGLAAAAAGWLALRDPVASVYRPVAAVGYDSAVLGGLVLPPHAALLACGAAGVPCLFTTPEAVAAALAELPAATRTAFESARPPGLVPGSLAVVPVAFAGRAVGVLWLVSAQGSLTAFAAADGPLLGQLGALIGLALDRAQREAMSLAPASPPGAQVRSEALATLSHELRTPLAAIKGYATALLLEEVAWAPADQREFLTLIDRETDTVQAMLSEVLDSARIDAGHLGLEPEPVRLAPLARAVADDVQRETARHRLVVDFPPDFPLLVADARRLRQVLRNLLDNAVKYSPDGGLIVLRGEARPGDVVLSVADQGVGIAPEDLILLFNKYFRVQRAHGEHVPGTGLGLPITRAIVEAHGGRIWAESKLGQGTTLYCSLPREAPAAPEAA